MNLSKIAKKRANAHLFFIPTIISLLTYSFEKELSLIIPIGYIFLISIAQYIRLKTTQKRHLKTYSLYFFRTLKNIFIVLFLSIVALLIGVAS
jgi:hypothetical protein